jgi:hypothetical protein
MISPRRWKSEIWERTRLNLFIYPGIRNHRSADFLHSWYERRKRRLGWLRIAFNALVYAGFWLWVPQRAARTARHWDKDAEWVRRAITIGRKWMFDPEDLAAFDIMEEEQARHYQRRMEQVPIIRTIENAESDHNPMLINKLCFQRRCEEFGFPVPRLLATIDAAGVHLAEAPRSGMCGLLKPVQGSGGRGVRFLSERQMANLDQLAKELGAGPWLVQERIIADPQIAPLSCDALPTVRMITLLDEAGEPELVNAALRYAAAPSVAVDNGHAGGLIASIDCDTGVLGQGKSGWKPGRYSNHPFTGAAIEGFTLPNWPGFVELVLRAHSSMYAGHVIIGWDVGASSAGPILIEANQRPAVRLTQRASGKGIGQIRYGDLIAWHLARADAERRAGRPRYLARS